MRLIKTIFLSSFLLASATSFAEKGQEISIAEYDEALGFMSAMMMYIQKTDKVCKNYYALEKAREAGLMVTWDTQNNRYTSATLFFHKRMHRNAEQSFGKEAAIRLRQILGRKMKDSSETMVNDLFRSFDNDRVKACQFFELMLLSGKYNINEQHPHYGKILRMTELVEAEQQ